MIEPATKMLTLLVVGSYALGYLIVVINENAYGFLETSLIKPRASMSFLKGARKQPMSRKR
jgi:hypothetical protein